MKTNSTIFSYIFISFLSISNLSAQKYISVGLSSQLINTRIVDLSILNLQTKGAFRPASNIYTEFNFGKRYAVHTGIGYAMMTQNSDQFRNNFNYLSVPVYFKIGRLKENKRFAFTASYGYNIQYLVKAQHIYLDETKSDLTDLSQRFHFDIVTNIGIKYKLTENVRLEALTYFAFGSFVNNITPAKLFLNNYNRGFVLNIAYNINK